MPYGGTDPASSGISTPVHPENVLNWIVTQSGGEIELTDTTPTATEVLIRLPLAYRETEPAETADKATGD